MHYAIRQERDMFAGFNLEINEHFFDSQEKTFSEYQKIGKEHLDSQRRGIEKTLNEYINDNIIDGYKIQKDFILASIVSNNMT